MSTPAAQIAPTNRSSMRIWLFSPFRYVAGAQALGAGLLTIFVSGIIASWSGFYFDGMLDFHVGSAAPVSLVAIQGLVNWLAPGLVLFVGGLAISKSHIRLLDVLGTMALARFPTFFMAVSVLLLPGVRRTAVSMASDPGSDALSGALSGNVAQLVLFSLLSVAMVVWMVALMWKAFSTSCNVRGGKAIAVFVVGLILAWVASKFIIGAAAAQLL